VFGPAGVTYVSLATVLRNPRLITDRAAFTERVRD
jgi:hypothetical protein